MKKLLAFLTLGFVFMMSSVVSANEADYEYTIKEDDTVKITMYVTRSETDIEIPAEIAGKKVTEIGEGAFRLNGLTSVVIPESVEIIGKSAFASNSLTEVTIPENVQIIRDMAFTQNRLTQVKVYSKDVSYSEGAFLNFNPTEIVLLSTKGSTSEEFADKINYIVFAPLGYDYTIKEDDTVEITNYTGNETDIEIPSKIEGKAVTEIDSSAFRNKGLTSVVISESIEDIGNAAFSENNLQDVQILGNPSIYSNAFDDQTT
uniref:leucine-rich repeat domain-containing protein n=1 Tax=uncultured Allobacillus sp. TaxID=1638025 RepID=UPI0025954039